MLESTLNCNNRKARITYARLPVHNDASFPCKGLNEHLIEALVLLPRPTPWCVAPHHLICLICEVLDETVPREVESKVLKPLTLLDYDNGTRARIHLDKETQGLYKQNKNPTLDTVNKRKNISKFETRKEKRKRYECLPYFINRTWRSQEEVVQAPPIVYLVVSKLEGPLSKIPQDLRFGGMDDEDNCIIMKIALCKTEECLEVIIRLYVPSGNGRVGDSRHRNILRGIRNE